MYGDCILLFHKVPNQPASKMSAPCTTAADRPMFCEGSCVIIQLCNTQRIYTQFQRKYSNHSGGLDSSILPLVSLGTWCGKMKYGRLYIIQDFTWRFCSLDYTTDRLDIYLLSWGSFWKVHLEMNNKADNGPSYFDTCFLDILLSVVVGIKTREGISRSKTHQGPGHLS